MNTLMPNQRGLSRRVNVRSTSHYNVMQLDEGVAPSGGRPKQLSPAALWILLAYLPPEVRGRPWVRHLVEQQLSRVDKLPQVDPRPSPMVRTKRSPEASPLSPR